MSSILNRRTLPRLEVPEDRTAPAPCRSMGPGSEAPGGAATDPPAENQTGQPASPRSDPAREPLSRFQRLSLALSVVALLISALGFAAVIFSIQTAQGQMNYMNAQTRVQIRDRSLSNCLSLHKIFLDQPELRPYFFEGKDLKESDPLYPKVVAVAEMHLDVFAYNLDYRLVFPDDYRRPEDYKRYICSRLALSPVMRRHLEKHAEWFSPYLQHLDDGRAGQTDTVGCLSER